MNFKKVNIKTEETIVKRTTQTVEMDFDFTQVYDCMYSLSFKLKSPISFQLLFYILKDVTESNMINITNKMHEQFSEEMFKHSKRTVSKPGFYKSIRELIAAKIITKTGRGQYFLNPYVLWKNDKEKRLEYIKAESLSDTKLAYNPTEAIKYVEVIK